MNCFGINIIEKLNVFFIFFFRIRKEHEEEKSRLLKQLEEYKDQFREEAQILQEDNFALKDELV